MILRELGAIVIKVGWRLAVLHPLRRIILALVKKKPGSENRVLIVQLDNVGDVALAAGSLASTVRAFPDKEVHLLVDRAAEPIARQMSDYVVAIDRHALRSTLVQSVKILAALKRTGYGTVVHHSTIQLGLVEYYSAITAIGAGARVGYAGEAIFANPRGQHLYDRFVVGFVLPVLNRAYTTLVPSFDSDAGTSISHVLRHYEHFFRGFTLKGSTFDAAPLLQANPASREKPYAVIGLGAAVPYRRWPVERFAEVAKSIASRGMEIVLVGSPSEKNLGEQFLGLIPNATNLIGSTSMTDVLQLIAGAEIVICNETAFAHLAVGLKKPLVCILGGGHLGRCSLHGYANTIWVHVSSPCNGDNWACGRKLKTGEVSPCIAAIPASSITNATERALSATDTGTFRLP